MKKIIFGFLAMLVISPAAKCGHGGDAFAGGAVGGILGGVVGSAITSGGDSKHSRRAEEEARRAQDQTEQLRREQQQEKLLQIQREMDRKDAEYRLQLEQQKVMTQQKDASSPVTFYFLIGLIILLFVVVAALGFVFWRKRD
jgi:Flp pilus assembly protein TadB